MEYTKGEWRRKGNKIEAFGKGVIAYCPSPTTSDGVLEFIANAHLIAAAPSMHEALKLANRMLTASCAAGMQFYHGDLDDIDKALAQAEGRQDGRGV